VEIDDDRINMKLEKLGSPALSEKMLSKVEDI